MEYRRKEQLTIILILVIAIASLSVGFAAFSATLNISSSATVNPSSDNFKIKIYGLKELYTEEDIYENFSVDMLSENISVGIPWSGNDVKTTGTAVIDNQTHTIKEMNTYFDGTISGEDKHMYYFLIKNEGEYDAYIDTTTIKNGISHICTAAEDTTKEYVDKTCDGVEMHVNFSQVDFENLTLNYIDENIGNLKIEKGETIALFIECYIGIYTNTTNPETGEPVLLPIPDGDWSIQFEDIKLNISTAPPTTN